MACVSLPSLPTFPLSIRPGVRCSGRIRVSLSGNSTQVDGVGKKERVGKDERLEPLWDDGFGTNTVKDYFERAKSMINNDGGPPRWFCPVECGRPIKGSPVLFFLPGIDGLGLGLCLHHKTLGRVFEVRCLHIPVYDRTGFRELVRLVETAVRLEHELNPDKPIYLVGESFGGCLALAVAARNPSVDIVLVLVNPATSVDKSQLQPLFPILDILPDELHVTIPYFLSSIMGNPIQMALVDIDKGLPIAQMLEQLSANLAALLPFLSGLADIIPKKTLAWRLSMTMSAAAYVNSRLLAVKAEVLLLASGKDNLLPSRDEAQRLSKILQNCTVRYFPENGHTLLLEDGLHLLGLMKSTFKYRRSRLHDHISDFIPPSSTELKNLEQYFSLILQTCSSVMLSTMGDGDIVRGLAGVPNEGPVLFVGYHMLGGIELVPLIAEFLRERRVMVRGMAHPSMFTVDLYSLNGDNITDKARQFGAVPVTANNLYSLLSSDSFALLYPGGIREALHRKGEEYKLFWPEQPEFVRMAARFEATIVPFGVVGEDDFFQMVLDYNEQMSIPIVRDFINYLNQDRIRLRGDAKGEVINQDVHVPGVIPKIPGRFYYLFGKPIETKGKKELLKDKASAQKLYTQIQTDIEGMMAYLKKKRDDDPFRDIIKRTAYKAISSPTATIPSFEP